MGRAEDIFSRIQCDGFASILEFIQTRQSEELFLDFKRSSDNGEGQYLNQTDRNNFAKAISGFGNSEGGVVIWGVDCSRDEKDADVARFLVPLADANRFRSWLEGAVSGCTVPPHSGVCNHIVLDESNMRGYVATLVSKSETAPHLAIPKNHYYIRAGSAFVPAPHGVLAGLFGRRPQPRMIIMFVPSPAELRPEGLHMAVGFLLHNMGPGIASDVYITLTAQRSPGPNCVLDFNSINSKDWSGCWSFKRHLSMIAAPSYRLPPNAHCQPVILEGAIAPPFEHSLKIEGIIGCSGSPPVKFVFENDAQTIKGLYEHFVAADRSSALSRDDRVNIIDQVLNIGKIRGADPKDLSIDTTPPDVGIAFI